MRQSAGHPERFDPYRNFKFRVIWDGRQVAGVSKVSGLDRPARIVGHRDDEPSSRRSPGRTEYEAITLERGVTHDAEFQKWASAGRDLGSDPGAGAPPEDFRRDLTLEVCDETGKVEAVYKLRRCWVSEFQALPDLDVHANAVAIMNLKLENEGWERDLAVNEPEAPLEGPVERIEVVARWEDLVMPAGEIRTLHDVAEQVRRRRHVHEEWGSDHGSGRGPGVSALFAGGSGAGRITAAEVLAGELRLDLRRIDLSNVISRHVGETEKNLSRVFDAAEAAGVILLLDEADALFGRRSEVEDGHDRYANIETDYLLQRIEAHRGLTIVATGSPQEIDPALLRRLDFVVQLPPPRGGPPGPPSR